MKFTWKHWLALLLLCLGIVLGMLLAGVAVWGDLEAFLFDSSMSPDTPLTTLRCPILITSAQTTTVSASFKNTLDRPVDLVVRAHISRGFVSLMNEESTRLPLEPGQSQRLAWTIRPDDAAFGRVVLVRVHVLPIAPYRYSQAYCGVVLVDLPGLPGDVYYAIGLVLSLACGGGGLALWILSGRPLEGRRLLLTRALGVLMGLVALSILFAVLKLWALGLAGIVIILLLVGAIVGHLTTTMR